MQRMHIPTPNWPQPGEQILKSICRTRANAVLVLTYNYKIILLAKSI